MFRTPILGGATSSPLARGGTKGQVGDNACTGGVLREDGTFSYKGDLHAPTADDEEESFVAAELIKRGTKQDGPNPAGGVKRSSSGALQKVLSWSSNRSATIAWLFVENGTSSFVIRLDATTAEDEEVSSLVN